jgi:NAD(P) transhydrogenase subunit alpha
VIASLFVFALAEGAGEAGTPSPTVLIASLYVFALAAFLGYQVISRVPPLLHTPLMSATNAISAISVVGSIVTAGAQFNRVSTALGFIAVVSATINVVGGFMITDRMLKLFKDKIGGESDKEAKR